MYTSSKYSDVIKSERLRKNVLYMYMYMSHSFSCISLRSISYPYKEVNSASRKLSMVCS